MIKNISNNPFFSVITCTYNSEKFIKKNLDSVSTQTFKNYEHILIDGNSSDGTGKIIEEYIKLNPTHVRIFQRAPMGISDAMNEGIKRARGKYIIHLHSDDYFYDNKVLRRTYQFIVKNKYPDWVYGKIRVVEAWGAEVGIFPRWKILQQANTTLLKLFNYIPHQSVFVKKDIFTKFGGFDDKLKFSMDYDLWLRLAGKTRWVFMDRIISNYTIHKDSQSSNKNNILTNNRELNKVIKKRLSRIEYLLHLLVKLPLGAYNHTHR